MKRTIPVKRFEEVETYPLPDGGVVNLPDGWIFVWTVADGLRPLLVAPKSHLFSYPEDNFSTREDLLYLEETGRSITDWCPCEDEDESSE